MGENNSVENFHKKTNDLFQGFEFIRAYTYGLLLLIKGGCPDHV